MGQLDIRGTSLECFERGSGPPLVFVHGSASDYRTWRVQLDEFGGQYRAIAYSRRYHWPNERIDEGADYSMMEQVDDLQAVLCALNAAPAHLVGHSYGAFLCLLVAVRAPSLVRTLVLGEPPVLPLFVSVPPKPSEVLRLLVRRPRTAIAVIKFGAAGIGPATKAIKRGDSEAAMRIFGTAVLGANAYGRLPESRLEQVRANFINAEFLGSGFAPLEAQQVRSVAIPTLLVTGQDSPRLFHRLTDRLHELLPRAERIDIPGASHIIHEDNAPAYDAAVLAHLRKHETTVPDNG